MSFKFKRKVKILPGIYLNLSKSGVSTTIGPRGASINIGKQGVFLNTGIPGTGIYNRQKLFGDKNNISKIQGDGDLDLSDSIDNVDNIEITPNIATSEGLKGLKENLIESKAERETFSKELNELKDKLSLTLDKLTRKQTGLFSIFIKISTLETLQSELDQTSLDVEELQKQFDESKADINTSFDPNIEQQYQTLEKSFCKLLLSEKIWDITAEYPNNELKGNTNLLVTKTEVLFSLENIDFIKSIYPAFHLQNANGSQIYIYPAFILLMDNFGEMSLINFSEINFNFKIQRFVERQENIPSDSKTIDYVWAKINKDGSPDMRFKGNYKTPVVYYGSFDFVSNGGLKETYYISNLELAENFANEFLAYISLLKNNLSETNEDILPNISNEYFDIMKEFGENIINFFNKIKHDKQFINFIYQSPTIKLQPFKTSDELMDFYFVLDILKSFSTTANAFNSKSKESFALIYLTAMKNGLTIDSYSNLHLLYDEKFLTSYKTFFNSLKTEIEKPVDENAKYRLSFIIGTYNKDWQKEYLTLLYRFVSIIIKADGLIAIKEEDELKNILILTGESDPNLKHIPNPQIENTKIITKMEKHSLEQALAQLNSLIGLSEVKQEINSLINFIKVQKARESEGLKSSSISYHMVFTGNPGTGKTTVARIVSAIYKNLGVLTKGQLVETDRAGLVAEYSGQTAIKVNKTIDSALGGILFIDEAYSLVGENQDDFGREAVSTLIKRMEDNRDNLVVIIAGYIDEMRIFIDSNPGIKSRFNQYIEFNDYIPSELLEIFELQAKKLDYTTTTEVENKLTELFTSAFLNRDKSFGNGRYVRNIFEKTLEKQANRIAGIPTLTKEILTTITIEDIPSIL